jgi:outer membrane protein assembly factor BamB
VSLFVPSIRTAVAWNIGEQSMNCNKAREEIELYVLGDVSAAQRKAIAEHLYHCPECRLVEAEYLALMQRIREETEPQRMQLQFALNLRSAVREEIANTAIRSHRRRVGWAIGITAGCTVLGIVILAIQFGLYNNWQSNPSDMSGTESPQGSHAPEIAADLSEGSWRSAWQFTGARAVTSSAADELALGGGRVYAWLDEDDGNHIAAYDAVTGQRQWCTEAEYCGFLASDDLRVYGIRAMRTGEFALTALDGSRGKVLWSKVARNPSRRPWRPNKPIVLAENTLCWTTCNHLHMFRCSDGKTIWSARFGKEHILSEVIPVGSRLYVAGQQNLYCVDPATGQADWSLAIGESSGKWRQPLLTGGNNRVFVSHEIGFGNSRVTCIDIANQAAVWEKTLSRISHLCAGGERLYVRSQHIQAFDVVNGREVWEYSAAGCGPVTYAQRRIYFIDTSRQGCLIALNESVGEKVWQWSGVASCNAFVRVGDLGYLKTNDGVVHAIYCKG